MPILWNSMTSTFFVFTNLANTMKYGGGFLYNLVFTEWRHCVSQNEVWGRECYITLFSPSDVTAFHRIGNRLADPENLHIPGFKVEKKNMKFSWIFYLDIWWKKLTEGLNVSVNYEFNMLDHVRAVAKTGGGGGWRRRTKGTTVPLRAQRVEG